MSFDFTADEMAQIDEAFDIADDALDQVFQALEPGIRKNDVAFGMWCTLTNVLLNAGWTPDELCDDVRDYAEDMLD